MKSNRSPKSQKALKTFGLTTGAMVALIFGLAWPWFFSRPHNAWPWILTGALWSVALILPGVLRPVFTAWTILGHWLGWLNTRIILGIMYYSIFLLFGLALKSMGKDSMARKIDKTAESYRVRSHARSRDHVERPF